jgi:hypothetical protein
MLVETKTGSAMGRQRRRVDGARSAAGGISIHRPRLARFVQPDPIGYGDGTNMYAAMGGDPVNRVDPTGTCASGYVRVRFNGDYRTQTGPNGESIVTSPSMCLPQDWLVRSPDSRLDNWLRGGGGGGGRIDWSDRLNCPGSVLCAVPLPPPPSPGGPGSRCQSAPQEDDQVNIYGVRGTLAARVAGFVERGRYRSGEHMSGNYTALGFGVGAGASITARGGTVTGFGGWGSDFGANFGPVGGTTPILDPAREWKWSVNPMGRGASATATATYTFVYPDC